MATARRRKAWSRTARRAVPILAAWVVAGTTIWTTSGAVGADAPSGTVVFIADGTYTVPEGVTSLRFTVTGAGGGSSTSGQDPDGGETAVGTTSGTASTPGGNGGIESGLLSVAPGETLTVVVGRGGGSGSLSADQPDEGGIGGAGFGDGGNGGNAPQGHPSAGGGGGGSAILTGTEPLVVAGGGGGASGSSSLILGSPLNYFGGCQWPAIDASSPASTTPSTSSDWNIVSCPTGTDPTPASQSWVDACPGLAPGSPPSALCPLGDIPAASRDGAVGVAALSDVHHANGPGGGGGGGATGGAGGVPAANSLTTGGGQGGVSFADTSRTSEVAESSADNAGGTGDPTTFCSVGDHIQGAGDDTDQGPPTCTTVGSPAGDGEVALTPVAPTDAPSTSASSNDPSTTIDTAVSPAATAASGPSPSGTIVPPTSTASTSTRPSQEPTTITVDEPDIAATPVTKAATTAAPAAVPVASTPTYAG